MNKKKIKSRGFRNNNPLNIRHGVSRWVGRAKEQNDPDFVTFTSMPMGYRAAWKQIVYASLNKTKPITYATSSIAGHLLVMGMIPPHTFTAYCVFWKNKEEWNVSAVPIRPMVLP